MPENERVRLYMDGAHTVESLSVCVDWFRAAVEKESNELARSSYVFFFRLSNLFFFLNLLVDLIQWGCVVLGMFYCFIVREEGTRKIY
jgi:hypothetical protein